jgi:hypothetical protein
MAFQPKDGKAQWEKVFDLVRDLPPGTVVTFKQLSQVLGYDISQAGRSRGPVHKASEYLLAEKKRALVPDRGKGYRVALASEHLGLARKEQASARRKVDSAVALTVNVDRNQLTLEQRAAVDAFAHVVAAQAVMLSRQNVRIDRAEQRIEKVDDRVTVLEALLRHHGVNVPKDPGVVDVEDVDQADPGPSG